MRRGTNTCFLTGMPYAPEFSHESYGKKYYRFEVSAFHGDDEQIVNCIVPEDYLDIVNACVVQESSISLYGCVKSIRGEDKIRKMFMSVKDVSQALPFEEDENFVSVEGNLKFAQSWGTDCNFLIVIPNQNGSDAWIPCTTQYGNALSVIKAEKESHIKIEGFIKSREVKSNGDMLNIVYADKITFQAKGERHENLKNRSRKLQGLRPYRSESEESDIYSWSEQARQNVTG